jgi:hypothetical protein
VSAITAETDTSGFEEYVRRLARAISPTNPEGVLQDVVYREAAAVLKLTASFVKPAKLGAVKAQRAFHVLRRIDDGKDVLSVNSGKRGGRPGLVWFGEKPGGRPGRGGRTWRPVATYRPLYGINRLERRVSDEDNAKVERLWRSERNEAREAVKLAVARRGLAMRGWLDAIEALGLDVDTVPPQSAKIPPNARNPRRPQSLPWFSRKEDFASPGQFLLVVTNRSGLAVRTGGKNLVERAIRRRSAAFKNALKNGVFEKAEDIAKFYPGIRIQ